MEIHSSLLVLPAALLSSVYWWLYLSSTKQNPEHTLPGEVLSFYIGNLCESVKCNLL